MAINFLNDVKVVETAASSWTEDKFVVLDSGVLKYRTGAQVISDLPTDSRYVAVAGDTMTGNLTMNNSQIQITDSGTQARMSINNTGTGDPQINFQLSGSSKFTIGVDDSDSDKFKISAGSSLGSSDRIVVDSSGNVGIGTTSPGAKLDVNGNFRINTNNLAFSGNPSWGVPFQNIIGSTDNTNGATLSLINTNTSIPLGGASGTLQFLVKSNSSNGYATASISAISEYNTPGSGQSGGGALIFKTGGYYSDISEKMRIGFLGQIGFGGANYGTSGQVLTSNGSGSAPSWQDASSSGSSYTPNIVSGATTASKDNLYIFTASATLTLPASPSAGDSIKIANLSGVATCVIARNTKNIMAVGEDMTLDDNTANFELIYTNATQGWVIIGAN